MAWEWTPQRTSVLIVLWGEGHSTSEMGRRLGITKNAVVGKVHRLGLPKRMSPIKGRTTNKAKPRATEKRRDMIRMETLTAGMCSWPTGEPGTPDFHFCGDKSIPDKPYCDKHCAMAYVRGSKSKDSRGKPVTHVVAA